MFNEKIYLSQLFSLYILGGNMYILSCIFLNFNVVGVNPYLYKLELEKRLKNELRQTKKVISSSY